MTFWYQQEEAEAAKAAENALKERLKLKWLPYAEGFREDDVEAYEQYLGLQKEEQIAFCQSLSDDQYELYNALETSRAFYVDPVDRNPGSITEEKVARYPERYK